MFSFRQFRRSSLFFLILCSPTSSPGWYTEWRLRNLPNTGTGRLCRLCHLETNDAILPHSSFLADKAYRCVSVIRKLSLVNLPLSRPGEPLASHSRLHLSVWVDWTLERICFKHVQVLFELPVRWSEMKSASIRINAFNAFNAFDHGNVAQVTGLYDVQREPFWILAQTSSLNAEGRPCGSCYILATSCCSRLWNDLGKVAWTPGSLNDCVHAGWQVTAAGKSQVASHRGNSIKKVYILTSDSKMFRNRPRTRIKHKRGCEQIWTWVNHKIPIATHKAYSYSMLFPSQAQCHTRLQQMASTGRLLWWICTELSPARFSAFLPPFSSNFWCLIKTGCLMCLSYL